MIIEAQLEDMTWFLERGLPRQKAIDCAHTIACFRAYMITPRHERSVIATTIMNQLPNCQISNVRVLQRRIQVFAAPENEQDKTGRWSLISGKLGNLNAKKIETTEIERLVELMGDTRKPSFEMVCAVFNSERGKDYSVSVVKQLLNDPNRKSIWTMARDGEAEWKKEYERTIHRERASEPSMLWSLDGFTIQLYYLDERGVACSNLYAIVVCDCCTDKIVGWSIYDGKTDKSEHVLKAVLNAIRQTGHRPLQLQYDNSSGNKANETQSVFNRLAKFNFPVAPYNGQVKPIERVYGNRIEGQELRLLPNFKGGNITANSLKVRVNPESLKEAIIPNRIEAIMQLEAAFESSNNTKVKKYNKSPNEMWYEKTGLMRQNGINRLMPRILEIELFWLEKAKTIKLTKNGLGLRFDGSLETIWYETNDDFYKANVGLSFKVRFNPENDHEVALFDDRDDRFIIMATKQNLVKMAMADRKEGDGEKITQLITRRKTDVIEVKEKVQQMKRMQPIDNGFGRVIRKIEFDDIDDYSLQSKTQSNESQDFWENEINGMPAQSRVSQPTITSVRKLKAVLDDFASIGSGIERTDKRLL